MTPDYEQLYLQNVKGAKRSGDSNGQFIGLCPFHDDKNPSFTFNTETGLCHCFKGCISGNAYQFAKKIGVDPAPYMNGGITRMAEHSSPNRNADTGETRPMKVISDNSELPPDKAQEAILYHRYLVKDFDTLCRGLPWTLEAIKRTFTGYDVKAKNFTFVHTNTEGKPLNIKWGKQRQVKGYGNCRLYPIHLLKDYSRKAPLIFCEGENDCLTLLSNGWQAVTGTTGAQAIPGDLSPLKGFKRIVILYDNDRAGESGSKKLAKKLIESFPEMKVWVADRDYNKPEGYDITDYFRDGGTLEGFDEILSHARECKHDPKEFHLTDAGNAEFLIHLYGDQIRYNHTEGAWYIWNGNFWKRDEMNQIIGYVIQMARQRQALAIQIKDPKQADKVFKFGKQSEGKVKIGFCLELAKSFPPVSTIAKDWNRDPYLLQFNNGVYNLKTSSFSKGSPDSMISKTIGLDFSRSAKCPRWEQFVSEIMNGNSNLMDFLQRAVGYSLSGDITEQCYFLLHGSGANGKSVTLEILRSLMGDYATDSPFSAFEYRYAKSNSNDLARLSSARLVTSAESGSSKRLDEERLKAITGGDTITARFLFKEFFTFSPTFKLWLAVNSLPKVEDFSHGFWRRVRLIPFVMRFEGEKADRMITNKLKAELPGIMNWAIEGFNQWRTQGLNPPQEIVKATKDYQNEADVVSEFIDSMVIKNPESIIRASELYRAFCNWWEEEYNGKPISQTPFGRRVSTATGIKSDKINGFKHYQGLELKGNDNVPF